jgi:hypothetical protein
MDSTNSESQASFFRIYTRTLTVLNICLGIAAVVFPVGGVVFFVTSYVFNDSGHVPEMAAPIVRFLFLDAIFAIILLIWQIKARKGLVAMLPAARKSMLALGIAYVVIAVINLFQFYLFSLPLAAIGIWWLVYFSRGSTRAAFEDPQPSTESLPPAN